MCQRRCLPVSLSVVLLLVLSSVLLATPPNVKVNSDVTDFLDNEQQIWVSPLDADIVITDWRDWRLSFRQVGVAVSTDGGATWSDSLVSNTFYTRQSDPCLTIDSQGRFYLCVLDYESSSGTQSRISVYRSDDNGVSWSGPVSMTPEWDHFEDKQFTTVDRTGGIYDGNFYCSWTRFPNPTRIMVVRSTDGAQTFEDTVKVGPEQWYEEYQDYLDAGQFSIPVVDADGDVHVFWQGYDLSDPPYYYAAIKHSYSTDGGETFSEDAVAFYNNMTYWDADGGIDVYGMPNADCDISGGPYHGTIYVSQCQIAEGSLEEELDVTVRKSTDKGETWTDRQPVNDDPPLQNVDQFHPWLVVNEDGVVLLIFYDQRDDPSHYLFNSYFSASFDGGETYIHNSRISDVSINPGLAFMQPLTTAQRVPIAPDGRVLEAPRNIKSRAGLFAEYIGISANHDTVSTIWTDTRNGNQDSYYARFLIPFERPRLYLPEDGSIGDDATPDFRWSTCWHETDDSYRLEVSDDPDFASVAHMASGISDNNYTPAFDLPVDQLYWRVKAFRTDGDSTDYSETFALTVGPKEQCGDADGDLLVNVTDAVFIIQYIFNGGAAPDPLSIADVNCDGLVNITDAVYLVAYIFGGGPIPCEACP